MECEFSLPCSQQPFPFRHPDLDEPSPCPSVFYLRYILILSPNLHIRFHSNLFSSSFQTKNSVWISIPVNEWNLFQNKRSNLNFKISRLVVSNGD
jgi:hypothetical protein